MEGIPPRLLALYENDPREFFKVIQQVNSKIVVPHPGQKPVFESRARFKVMNCGRRFGKTVVAAKILVTHSRQPKKMLWWVAPTYRIVKRGYDEVLRQLPDGVLAAPAPPSSNFDAGRPVILRFKNGTLMEFYSAERPEGMLGAAVDFVILDEAARMKATTWNQTISPTLIDHLGGALLISTPRGHNWFYRVWQKGQDPQEREWASWTFTTQDNPTLPPGEPDRMAADMPKLEADQEIYAKWVAAGSSVFILDNKIIQKNEVLRNGLVKDVPPAGHVVLGIDLARTNDFTVIYGNRARDRRNVYFERFQNVAWAEQRRRIARACRTLAKHGATGITLCVDEGNAGSVIVEDLEEQGYDVVGINFTTHKANMVRLLANDLERGRAVVLDQILDEFEAYQINQTPTGRMQYSAPEGMNDDVVSAKMLAHWGLVNEGVPEVQTISPLGDDLSDDSGEDPWDSEGDYEPWDDLVDDDDELADHRAAYEAGLVETTKPPTVQELLLRPELWF